MSPQPGDEDQPTSIFLGLAEMLVDARLLIGSYFVAASPSPSAWGDPNSLAGSMKLCQVTICIRTMGAQQPKARKHTRSKTRSLVVCFLSSSMMAAYVNFMQLGRPCMFVCIEGCDTHASHLSRRHRGQPIGVANCRLSDRLPAQTSHHREVVARIRRMCALPLRDGTFSGGYAPPSAQVRRYLYT